MIQHVRLSGEAKLRRICDMSEDRRRTLTPAERDQMLQRAIWQGMSPKQRMKMTRQLCELVGKLKKMRSSDGAL